MTINGSTKPNRFVDFENASETEPVALPIRYTDGRYFVTHNGQEEELSLGEILTDGDWGLHYDLDPKSVPRQVCKRYLVEAAKRELRDLLDWQIYFDETSSERTHAGTKEAYQRVIDSREGGYDPPGIVAERLIKNFFKKLVIDHDLDVEVEEADLFQDVCQKIDFIIHRKHHYRGVGVEEVAQLPETLGVQFTIDSSAATLAQKQTQLERARQYIRAEDRIDDILLVLLDTNLSNEIHWSYLDWQRHRSPKGPSARWSDQVQEALFHNILKDILTPEEITAQWEKITPK